MVGTVVHEIGHTIGFIHEHARPDRDEFVTIHSENVGLWALTKYQFVNWSAEFVTTNDIPYDHSSIMHYDRYVSKSVAYFYYEYF